MTMSDETDKSDTEATEAEQQGPRAGELLADARREKQISVLEIAKELHIDERKVRALENNEFDKLGAPVFAKGHLRKYAQLVGVSADDVLTDYYRLTRADALQPVVAVRKRPKSEQSPGPWIAVAVIVLIIAIVYWLLATRPFSSEQPRPRPAPAAPVEQETRDEAPPEDPAVEADDQGEESAPASEDTDPVTSAVEPEAESTPEPQPVAETPPPQREPVQQGTVVLQVTFNGDCWTEISDATGRRLFFNLGQAGRTVTVTGQEPLSVLFGDADNVSLVVNGNEFTIADADRRGRTARFLMFGT
jgi:cytoskeleton protein RodZ